MYKIITSILFSIILSSQSFSQTVCTRTVADFGSFPTGGYMVQGTATLTDSLGIIYLTLSNDFFTTAGPNLYLYLSINDEAPTVVGNTNVEISPLLSNMGSQTYIVPGNYSIDDFDYVLVHCKQFNHFWDGGILNSTNCYTTTGMQDGSSENKLVIKNSVFSSFTILNVITSQSTIYKLDIFSIDGKMMNSSTENTNSEVYIGENFRKGNYLIFVTYNNKRITQKIIKQ